MPPKKKTNRLAATIRKPEQKKPAVRTVRSTLNNSGETDLTRRTTIYLSPETWEGLKIAAAKQNTTLSKLMEQIGRDYLGK